MSSGSNTDCASVKDLISTLRSAFQPSEFDKVEQIIVDREKNLKGHINELLKEIEYCKKESQSMEKLKCELEKEKLEAKAWRKNYLDLECRISKLEEETEVLKTEDPLLQIKVNKAVEARVGDSSTNLADSQIKHTASNHHVSASGPVVGIDGLQATGPKSMNGACDNEVVTKKKLFKEEGRDNLIGSSRGVNIKNFEPTIVEISDSDDEIIRVKDISKGKRALCCPSEDDDDDEALVPAPKKRKLQQLIHGDNTSPNDAYAMPDSVSSSRQNPVLIGRCGEKIEAEQPVNYPLSKPLPDESSSESEDSSSEDESSKNTISELKSKGNEEKWEFPLDMCLEFRKDPELCLNAICALYRQRYSTTKDIMDPLRSTTKGFIYSAQSGPGLAKFLIDGDPLGRLSKSVAELQEYDQTGLDACRHIAIQHSTRLFEIYQKKMDPFFPLDNSH